MRTIKELRVKVTYKVWPVNVEVTDEVFNQLKDLFDRGGEINGDNLEQDDALNWLNNNIKETDSFDCYYEIDDMDDSTKSE